MVTPRLLGLRVFTAVMAMALLPLFAIFVLWLASRPVKGQDCELGAFGCLHHENHDTYKTWQRKGGKGSCCSNEDCRPVRARLEEDGGYSVWIPEFRRWIPVPDFAVGEPDRFGDGRSHVCAPSTAILGSTTCLGANVMDDITKNLESQTRLAVSVLGIAFAEALLQVQPDLEHPLKNAVQNWGRKMEGYGKGYEVAADSLRMLSRALHDREIFPKSDPS